MDFENLIKICGFFIASGIKYMAYPVHKVVWYKKVDSLFSRIS